MDLKSVLSKLGGDIDGLMKEYQQVSGVLSRFGLSEYESRAYVALVALGTSSAPFVAEVSQIPRTSAYKVMGGLERKGFVKSKQGRPRSFTPEDPSEVSKRMVAEAERAFSRIGGFKDMLSQRGVPQLVYTIMGKDRVLEKIGEMLDKSERSFVMATPIISKIYRPLNKKFSNALSRNVAIKVITSPFVKAPRGVAVTRRKSLIATDIISDGKTALLAAPDLSACGYTDNEALSKHLENFLRIMDESPE
jgi:sugar-specific transcriptional regulator TrmB